MSESASIIGNGKPARKLYRLSRKVFHSSWENCGVEKNF